MNDGLQNQSRYFQKPWGTLANGTVVNNTTLQNKWGLQVEFINLGGIITKLLTPDANGVLGDIVLGLDSPQDYFQKSPYMGAIIGRYGSRIRGGQFHLGNRLFQLTLNEGTNQIHGGTNGFDKQLWHVVPFTTQSSAGATLSLVSPDGDQGYPGELAVEITYELTDDNELDIRFSANTNKPTVVNLTHHSYFNLACQGSAMNHILEIPADYITPVDKDLIPTGELQPVARTPFDFTKGKTIGQDIEHNDKQLQYGQGYDHTWIINLENTGTLKPAAKVVEPGSGRILEVFTTSPGMQFYSGNFLDGSTSGKGLPHNQRTAFCLEPQHFPDSPNKPAFPGTILEPGQT